ncbi:MAG: AMP-dependent synthetase and ligase [Actinomycetia bacterium]|nr:AMP-dependent synthetase and ligase [Actinomycetes bacterium]
MAGFGANLALVDGDRTCTHAQLEDRSTRLTAALLESGMSPGERLAVMLPNSIELFEANRAAAHGKFPLVPVNWHLMPDEIAWILADSEAKVLIADRELAAQVEPAAARVPGCTVLWTGPDYERRLGGTSPLGAVPAPTVVPTLMLYTSGTTGRPKGVVHEHLRARSGASENVAAYGLVPDDVHLLAAPAYHGAPWSLASAHLVAGASVVIMRRWDTLGWLRLVREHGVTTTFAVPLHFVRLLDVPESQRPASDLSTLRLITHGGAPCPVPVKQAMLDWLPETEITEFYGFTEGGRVARINSADWRTHPGSAGRPVDGVAIRILGPEDEPLGAGAVGRIAVRPPGGSRFHYHSDAAKTSAAWIDGYCTVDDIGYLSDDGFLYVTDRSQDLILRGGVNIYPREIEDALFLHPAVVDCAVFGVPHDREGERVHALVETHGDVGADELVAHLRERIAGYKVPSVIELTDELPRDAAGKIRKHLLRDRAAAPPDPTAGGPTGI